MKKRHDFLPFLTLLVILMIGSLFFSCEKDDGLVLMRKFSDMTDSITSSIYVNIARVHSSLNENNEPVVIASVAVTNQDGDILSELTKLNFRLNYTLNNNAECAEAFHVSFHDETDPLAVAITMDYSGSMSDTDIYHMENAVREFVRLLKPDDYVQIIKFATGVTVMNAFTNDRSIINEAIDKSTTRGGTAFLQSIYVGLNELNAFRQLHPELITPLVIAFTDGNENTSYVSLKTLADISVESQIPVFPIGIGQVDDFTMNYIADRSGGRYLYATRIADIMNLYNRVYSLIERVYRVEFLVGNDVTEAGEMEVRVEVSYENALGMHHASASRVFYFR